MRYGMIHTLLYMVIAPSGLCKSDGSNISMITSQALLIPRYLVKIIHLAIGILCLGMLSNASAEVKTFQINGEFVPLNKDGIHDPKNDAINIFQHPKDAMAGFPRDDKGIIDWVKALDRGLLIARADKLGEAQIKTKDLDIILKNTGKMPYVKFPHRQHTEQLGCDSCHPGIFVEKAGANKIVMQDILGGKFCGVCHGKVSFPPAINCTRCHSVKR